MWGAGLSFHYDRFDATGVGVLRRICHRAYLLNRFAVTTVSRTYGAIGSNWRPLR